MGIRGYLAMTPREAAEASPLPRGIGWMSCHFSPAGLTDLPRLLPPGSLLILDDSIPPEQQDPEQILTQLGQVLERNSCRGLLLDFQRPDHRELRELASLLSRRLDFPVGVSEAYARHTDGPVFLSLVQPHEPLEARMAPWEGRELWLEAGTAPETITVRKEGAEILPAEGPLPPCPLADEALCCHYSIDLQPERAVFSLRRSPEDLKRFLQKAQALGITLYAGLYKELRYLPI